MEINKQDVNRNGRSSLENVFKYREIFAFFIDEAQHVTFNSTAKSTNNLMDMVKSQASIARTQHVLFIIYEILYL